MGKRLLALTLLLPALAGCGSSSQEAQTTSTVAAPPTTTAPAPRVTTITVFHVRNGVLRPSPLRVTGTGVAAAALGELGLRPTVKIGDGIARLEAPELTEEQRAEVVYTLTQFSTVHSVSINGGEPRTRADYQMYAPPIVVDTPDPGASVGPTFTVAGSASVFEATLVVQVVRDGKVLDKQNVTATAGAPDRGTFGATLHATAGPATVQAFSPSAVDGSPQHEVDLSVTVTP